MGVRPPQQGDDDVGGTVAFGIAALDEHLERADVSFPTTTDRLLERLEDPSVPYDAKGNEVPLSEIVEAAPVEQFDNRQELLNALHPVFEAKRERTNNSLVGRIRSLLPI